MAVPVVTCGATISLNYSTGQQSISLSATATNSPTSYHWDLVGLPLNSSAASLTLGDFVNGVATIQNPNFQTEGSIEGAYVFQCKATNVNGTSDPELDKSGAIQIVVVKTNVGAWTLPGSYQWDWGDVRNTIWTNLEALPYRSLSSLNAVLTDGQLDTTSSSRNPWPHGLGSSSHSQSTLAQLNALISDATLDTSTASRPPTGAATGDLSGTYPNPTVGKLQGMTVDTITQTDSYALSYLGSKWKAQYVSTTMSGYPDTMPNMTGSGYCLVGINVSENQLSLYNFQNARQNWPTFRRHGTNCTQIIAESIPGTVPSGANFRLAFNDGNYYTASTGIFARTTTTGLGGLDPTETISSGLWNVYAVADGGSPFSLVMSKAHPLQGTGGPPSYTVSKYLWTVYVNSANTVAFFVQDGKWNYYTQDRWGEFSLYQQVAGQTAPTNGVWNQFDGRTRDSTNNNLYNDVRKIVPVDYSDSVVVHGMACGSGANATWRAEAVISDGWKNNWGQTGLATNDSSIISLRATENGTCTSTTIGMRSGMISMYWPDAYIQTASTDRLQMNFFIEGYRNTLWGEDL